MEDAKPILAYKGFNADWKCRDFQYAVGETYEHNGPVSACKSGFHACVNPLDVLDYYDLCDSKFAVVEMSGEIKTDGNKTASGKISIKAELSLPQFIEAAIEWVKQSCNMAKPDFLGYGSQLAASGNASQLAASGNDSQLAASGDASKLAASGYGSKLAASGYGSQLAASGYASQLAASGNDSICVSSGYRSRAKIGPNGAMALTWNDRKRPRISVAYEGENGIKRDTWYSLDAQGNFVEVQS